VDALRLFGTTLDSPRSQMVVALVAFVLMALVVVAIRRSRFGLRLLAIRDSEAACATFGLNLMGTRLAVFMLSAAIAGLGGAIFATQATSISPMNFDFVTGLPIFMLVVVGGAGLVGGALFAGISLQGILPALSSVSTFFAKIQTMTPGLVGIGLGREPSGAAPQFATAFAPLRDDTPVLVGTLAALVAVWAARLLGVFSNWPMFVLMAVVVVLGLAGSMARARRAAEVDPSSAPVTDQPALEWMGITTPWTPEALTEMESHLQLGAFRRRRRRRREGERACPGLRCTA
jgi:branched-chain amino acid transport system permease protein